jgi:hypothetical protein
MDSNSGTGISPGSAPSSSPPPHAAQPRQPHHGQHIFHDAAPLMTYWRIASGEQPFLTSATTRKVSSTLAVSRRARRQRGRDGVG